MPKNPDAPPVGWQKLFQGIAGAVYRQSPLFHLKKDLQVRILGLCELLLLNARHQYVSSQTHTEQAFRNHQKVLFRMNIS